MKNVLFIIPLIVGLSACAPNNPQPSAKQGSGERSSQRPPKLNFASIDQNKDGKINLEEFTRAKPKSAGRKHRAEPTEIFNRIDLNNDGFLTPEELKQHRKQRRSR
ncbi:MAG: Unknown protein [uncultured Thiotrichaceae bacterium]|uniref:EF-hand domain-containing protein n=1 Tax=uncultured Thiotrichaceae bacterium TaxID=298394 RepID=A0A6S6SI39_9GAMM|nr:MAG: Unknown protein [uncultured Thiotrichaceae bacterium]